MKTIKQSYLFLSAALIISVSSLNAQGSFVSDYHKSHAGQIAFNKQASLDTKTAKDFVTEFDSKDDITAHVFMKTTIQSYDIYNLSDPDKLFKNVERKFFTKYFIDDVEQKVSGTGDALNGKWEGTTAFAIRVLSKSGNVSHNDFRNKILKLKGGKYKIRLEMWGGNGRDNSTKEAIAKGEFTLEKIEYVEPSIGKYSSLKAAMVNADIEQQALKIANDHAAKEGLGSKYSKPKIAHDDWEIIKNEYTGAIMCRTISVVLYETRPESKCRATYFRFKQDYTGGGKYSNKLLFNGIGVSDRVDCD
ncbi:MAG: hypothetical protein Q8M29_10720 [Bacteroidota bacterium]|nr:hypothetical protein [Bacteroidota bacterium]